MVMPAMSRPKARISAITMPIMQPALPSSVASPARCSWLRPSPVVWLSADTAAAADDW